MGAHPPTPDEPNDALDEDLEAFLEAWDEADREAAALLCTALDQLREH